MDQNKSYSSDNRIGVRYCLPARNDPKNIYIHACYKWQRASEPARYNEIESADWVEKDCCWESVCWWTALNSFWCLCRRHQIHIHFIQLWHCIGWMGNWHTLYWSVKAHLSFSLLPASERVCVTSFFNRQIFFCCVRSRAHTNVTGENFRQKPFTRLISSLHCICLHNFFPFGCHALHSRFGLNWKCFLPLRLLLLSMCFRHVDMSTAPIQFSFIEFPILDSL